MLCRNANDVQTGVNAGKADCHLSQLPVRQSVLAETSEAPRKTPIRIALFAERVYLNTVTKPVHVHG